MEPPGVVEKQEDRQMKLRLLRFARTALLPIWRVAVLVVLIILTRQAVLLNRDAHARSFERAFADLALTL
jgi:hypothetical protein